MGTDTKSGLSKFGLFSVLLIPFVWLYEASMVAPGLGAIAQRFTDATPFQLNFLFASPTITMIIFSLISGRLLQTFDKKKILIIGLAIYGVAGMVPGFMSNVGFMILARLIAGVGAGLVMPIPNAIIADHYQGKRADQLVGWAASVSNISCVVLSIIAGFLVVLGWSWVFYGFVIVLVIMLIAIAGVPSSPKRVVVENMKKATPAERRIPLAVFGFALLMMLNFLNIGNMATNMAVYIVTGKLAGPVAIGLILSLPAFIAIFFSATYARLAKAMGKYLMAIGFAGYLIAWILWIFAHSVGMLVLVGIFLGVGEGILTPCLLALTGNRVTMATKDVAFGIVASCLPLGIFVSPFFQSLVGMITGNSSQLTIFIVTAIVMAIVTIVTLIVKPRATVEIPGAAKNQA